MSTPTELPSIGSLDFSFEIVGMGWASATIADSSSRVQLTASYLSDALRNFLDAVLLAAAGGTHAGCVWDEEPGEYSWSFDSQSGEVQIRVEASEFPDLDEIGTSRNLGIEGVIFDTTASRSALVSAVTEGVLHLLENGGEEAYENRWGFPFPREPFDRLLGLARDVLV